MPGANQQLRKLEFCTEFSFIMLTAEKAYFLRFRDYVHATYGYINQLEASNRLFLQRNIFSQISLVTQSLWWSSLRNYRKTVRKAIVRFHHDCLHSNNKLDIYQRVATYFRLFLSEGWPRWLLLNLKGVYLTI